MSSLIDYFFMKSVDKCVVILINLMSSSRISIEFMMRNNILALDELYYHRPPYFLPSNTNLFMFCVIPLSSLLSSICSSLSWSITIFYVKDVVRTAPPLKEFLVLWYFSPSPFFLGPRVDSNQDTNMWTMLLGFCTSSNPIALKLMVDISSLDHWLSNHHSNIDLAT